MVKQVFQDEINAAKAIKAAAPQARQQRFTFTPLPIQQGTAQSEVDEFDLETGGILSEIRGTSLDSGGGAGRAAQRRSIEDRLKFGLEGIGLGREGLAVSRQEADIARRDSLEGAINNALQRGIFRSGIRVRNERRAGEVSDLRDERLDITGKRLDLSEKELRAQIKNALAGLRAAAADQASAARAQREQAELDFLRSRIDPRLDLIAPGIFPDVGREVAGPPGGGPRGGPR